MIVGGADSATALLMVNGIADGRGGREPEVAVATRHGLRFVTFGRPGYGDSTRLIGSLRRGRDARRPWPRQGLLGLTACTSSGWSGGGPHALACAALLPDLVAGVATIGSVAPFDAEGLDWLEGMAPENREEFGAMVAGPAELEAFLERFAADLRDVTGADVADSFGELVPQVDRAALTGGFADYIAASFRDSVRTGIWGWYDDDFAFFRDWGFDLASIRLPVTIWQGSEDRMVPFAHGRWLADHLPAARPRLLEGEGHLSLAVSSFDRIVDELVETEVRA